MYRLLLFLFSTCFICLNSCSDSSYSQKSEELSIVWHLDSNNYRGEALCKSTLTITNNSTSDLPESGWAIYFNFCRFIHPEKVEGTCSVSHINGDFFKLEPKESFSGLRSGETFSIKMISDYWAIKNSDAPAGFYIVYENENGIEQKPVLIGDPEVGMFTTKQQTNRNQDDILEIPTPELRYKQNEKISVLDHDQIHPIIPVPNKLDKKAGHFNITPSTRIYSDDEELGSYLNVSIETQIETKLRYSSEPKEENTIVIEVEDIEASTEDYQLTVSSKQIKIKAGHRAGIFYGIESLKALFPVSDSVQNNIEIPCLEVHDSPGMEYRGLHVDIARNFKSKEGLLKMLDLMGMYKLNKLHLHFCDDEGWRIEIPELPELTQTGGFRSHSADASKMLPAYGSGPFKSNPNGNGFYTQRDFVEILKYAAFRNIEIIPEIDVPGHARAAIKAMEARYEKFIHRGDTLHATACLLTDFEDQSKYRSVQNFTDNVVNVALESTYKFLEIVVESLAYSYQDAGLTLKTIHIGGDEVPNGVWEESPVARKLIETNNKINSTQDLKAYFLQRFSGILEQHHISIAGWEEIAMEEIKHDNSITKKVNPDFSDQHFIPFIWNNMWGWGAEDLGYKIANAGYPIVLNSVTNLYFDMAYTKDPLEPGYYWGNFTDTRKAFEFTPYNVLLSAGFDNMGHPIDISSYKDNFEHLTEIGKKNIRGIQGLIWTEVAKDQELMEYMVFPKMLGLAERAWNPVPIWTIYPHPKKRSQILEKQWNTFANSLGQKELKRLALANVNFRIPLPGAIIKDGILYANVAYPGLEIRYTLDGSNPTIDSELFTLPVAVSGTVKLKSFDYKERGSRVSVLTQ